MFYATHDFDGERIFENAQIVAFPSLAAAEAFLRAPFGSEWNMESATVSPGRFGDCWIKTIRPPSDRFLPFSDDALIIQEPGSHPGGAAYWITPSADVFVITGAVERDD